MDAELLAANLTAHWIQAGVLALSALFALQLLRVKEPGLALAALQAVLGVTLLLPWLQPWKSLDVLPPASIQAAVAVDLPVQPAGGHAPHPAQAPPVRAASIALSVVVAGILLRLMWLIFGVIRL